MSEEERKKSRMVFWSTAVACKYCSWPSYRAGPGHSAYLLRICVSAYADLGGPGCASRGFLVQAPDQLIDC